MSFLAPRACCCCRHPIDFLTAVGGPQRGVGRRQSCSQCLAGPGTCSSCPWCGPGSSQPASPVQPTCCLTCHSYCSRDPARSWQCASHAAAGGRAGTEQQCSSCAGAESGQCAAACSADVEELLAELASVAAGARGTAPGAPRTYSIGGWLARHALQRFKHPSLHQTRSVWCASAAGAAVCCSSPQNQVQHIALCPPAVLECGPSSGGGAYTSRRQ